MEFLCHFTCDACKKWWACGDIIPPVGKVMYCPHCGHSNSVEYIETKVIQDHSPPKKDEDARHSVVGEY
jgi:DNA-directed RNA polymerase subunit M/transcription elongation factor TFIIS